MHHLPRILFVVALCLFLEPFFQFSLDLCQSLQAILNRSKPCICALMHTEVSLPAPLEYLVHRGGGHPVLPDQIADADMVGMVVIIQLLALDRGEPCAFMY